MDLPKRVVICEEGPREGFQIEKGPIATADKIALIDALSQCGFEHIQVASFVSLKHVPGWADAEAVVAGMTARADVDYSAIWFNPDGLRRAMAFKDKLTLTGSISLSASEGFSIKNLNRDRTGQIAAMQSFVRAHQDAGVPINRIIVMASFGCNFAGDIAPAQVVAAVADGFAIARDAGIAIKQVLLADSMGWATPRRIAAAVTAVRERWPDIEVGLHLHDTRGQGIACAYEGLRLGVTRFDAAIAGLGGCPFAGHPGAPGNIATEELAILCDEMGIETGLDIEALIEAARLAERVVGHPLPSAALRSGSIASFRRKLA
jgi:isopropylmalate/homocitrate/citramalate synthase